MIESKYGNYGYKLIQTSTPRTPKYSKTDVRTMYSIYESITSYNNVKAKYVFQIEDDWRFYKYGFIEDSINVFKAGDHHKHLRISMLDLRNWQIYSPYLGFNEFCGGYMTQNDIGDIYDTNITHKFCEYDININECKSDKLKYWIYPTSKLHTIECFRHWSANPGLKKINGLQHNIGRCMNAFEDGKNIANLEHCVACQYKRKAYGMANTMIYNGYVGHLGGLYHIDQNQSLHKRKGKLVGITNLNELININDKFAINITNCQYVERT